MLQWETCSCWSHFSCVKISISLAQIYPFVCPLCVKDSVLLTSTLAPQVRKLEGSLQTLFHILQNTSGGALSIPVWDEFAVIQESVSSFSSALLPSKSQSKSPPLPSKTTTECVDQTLPATVSVYPISFFLLMVNNTCHLLPFPIQ